MNTNATSVILSEAKNLNSGCDIRTEEITTLDLRPFLDQLKVLNELETVEGADWNLEIGTLTELCTERRGKALLFDRIKGYPPGYRVIPNLIATPRRLAAAMGFSPDIGHVDLVRAIKNKFKDLKPIPPRVQASGPVMENVFREGDLDLLKFPAPKWHEYDGGRYLGTGDMVIMKDPKDGWINAATYRTQVHDRDTLGLNIAPGNQGDIIRQAYWAQDKPCPIAVVYGIHPRVWIPAFLAFPWGVEEMGVAGALLGEPLRVITGEYTGLPIPADSEIAIEGDYLPPSAGTREEGPFAEWPGYYASGSRVQPVIKVKRIMHRNNPIINGAPPLRPPSNSCGTNIMRAANIWAELERLGIPGIKGVWNMDSGGRMLLTVISIEQKYAGHAKQVAMGAMSGVEGGRHGKFTIVVDDDIDPANDEDVLWAMATRCDPATSIEVITGCWGDFLEASLSPEKRANGDITNGRAIILACRPYHWRKDFPRVNRASDELRSRTLRKWPELFPAG